MKESLVSWNPRGVLSEFSGDVKMRMKRVSFSAMHTQQEQISNMNTIVTFALIHTSIQSYLQLQTKGTLSTNKSKQTLKPVRQTLAWCGRSVYFKTNYVLITKEEG